MVFLVAIAFVVYGACLGIYRLKFSPLSKIPGPKLAALTYWYETYYEVWKGGQYFREVDKMHRQYGPIVRVTPNEVHFDDPSFLDVIYPSRGKKINKPDVRRLEPIVKQQIEQIFRRMEDSAKRQEVVKMHHLFKACASDIITLYAFGDSFSFLHQPDYGRGYFDACDQLNTMTHVFGNFPWLRILASSAPDWAMKKLLPSMSEFLDKKEWWIGKIREIRGSVDPKLAQNTILGGILNSTLPAEDKTDARVASEAQLVVLAGEGTTALALTTSLYHLLANPDILQRLRDELMEAVPERNRLPTASEVGGLPYLNAIINEAIRLHPGVMHRQVRVCPSETIVYKDQSSGAEYCLPPGTCYSISPLTSHMNSSVFKDPYEFCPQRWIETPEISRAFMGFSKGSRGCVGMGLARHEMTLVLASLFLKYDVYSGQSGPTLELFDTIRSRDIDANRDYIVPLPAKGSLGLRVKIRN
ncbi:cytochrome P450 [Trichoderma citrinoviride]|uniref:Cytochrome P450 n=1 Tax=Trichoderma citrinoviride TaxID=58853 RepID=A0A2T4BBP5_9HYPO|nr:cytochrome P450 [Trichoderma citrinoviride]PTB66762.1 cytochrome P450 [Trichoderma citrinoviride]